MRQAFAGWDNAGIAIGAVAGGRLVVIQRNGDITLWDAAARHAIRRTQVPDNPLTGGLVTPHGIVVVWGWEPLVYCLDAQTLELLQVIDVPAHLDGSDVDSADDDEDDDDIDDDDDDVDVKALADGTILISHTQTWLERFDPRTGAHVQSIPDDDEAERSFVAWPPQSSGHGQPGWIECHDWRNLRIWYPGETVARHTITLSGGNLIDCVPIDESHLAVRRRGGAVQSYALATGTLVKEVPLKATSMFSVSHRDCPSSLLIARAGDRSLVSFDPLTGREQARLPNAPEIIGVLPLRSGLVFAWNREQILVFDPNRAAVLHSWPHHGACPKCALEMADGTILSCGEMGGITWYDPNTGQTILE